MTRLIRLAAILLLASMMLPQIARAYPGQEDQYEIVFELQPGVDPETTAVSLLIQLDIPENLVRERVNHIYHHAINGFSAYLTLTEIAKAQRVFRDGPTMGLLSFQQSIQFSTPILVPEGGQIPATRLLKGHQVVPTGIQFINDSLTSEKGDLGAVDVAVIDTGVDQYHPDINYAGGTDCTIRGGQNEDPQPGHDGYGHGTHVAGTIGAKNDGEGVVGVAPGARIWSVKVLGDDGSGSTASVICGIDWVAEHADTIDVANMSLGGEADPSVCDGSDPMHDAVCAATDLGVIFVVAAGNSSTDASTAAPANYPEVVTVSAYADFDGQPGGAGVPPQDRCYAMSVDDELATFSNYGEDVDIAAPGTCILSTLPGDVDPVTGMYTPAYGIISGTSMASPHVAGAIARFIALNPDQKQFAVQQVEEWSTANNDPVPGDHDMIHEPLLYVGNGAPRYEAAPTETPAP